MPKPNPAHVERTKDKLMSPSERAAFERQYGEIVGPIIDAKLEAKARELIASSGERWAAAVRMTEGDGSIPRSELLVSREDAARMLSVSLSTIKRMEANGELPEPVRFGERQVRHRLIDIERLARFNGAPRVPGPGD